MSPFFSSLLPSLSPLLIYSIYSQACMIFLTPQGSHQDLTKPSFHIMQDEGPDTHRQDVRVNLFLLYIPFLSFSVLLSSLLSSPCLLLYYECLFFPLLFITLFNSPFFSFLISSLPNFSPPVYVLIYLVSSLFNTSSYGTLFYLTTSSLLSSLLFTSLHNTTHLIFVFLPKFLRA